MDESPSSTPSPTSATSSNRGNPFSIDYILSSSAAAAAVAKHQHQHQEQQHQHSSDTNNNDKQHALNQQINLMNQQRAQLMAAAAAAAAAAQSNDPSGQLQPQQQLAMPQQIKMGQQPPHPNLLYFMACMLLQQQQQQQNNQRQQQQQQQQQHVARQQAAAAAIAAATANNQQQMTTRQPIDLARSPMDSLAILARLTGIPPTNATTSGDMANSLGKQQPRLMSNQTIRHQPYQAPMDSRPPYPPLISPLAHHPLGALNNRQAADLMNQRRLSPLMNLKSLQQISGPGPVAATGRRFGLSSNGGSGPSSHHLHLARTTNTASPITTSANNVISGSGGSSNGSAGDGGGGVGNGTGGNNTAHVYNGSDKLDNLKPAHSYIGLIGMCILSSPEKRMVLNDIYQFILDNYPYYRNRGSGWRNSVRHNLSLNECFQKAGRAANGKGHYWTIHPANMEDFMLGDFRRRRAQRKVRSWNNMDVPSDESDDESMEDATKPPLPEHFKRSLEMHRRLELSYQKTAEATAAAAAAAAAASFVVTTGQSPLNATPSSGPCSPLFHRHQDL